MATIDKNTCRICASKNHKLHCIFATSPSGPQIIHLINQHLPIIVFRTDPFPKKICETCLNHLENHSKLKQTSLDIASAQISALTALNTPSLQLYLSCKESLNESLAEKTDAATSTSDLKAPCLNCSPQNELEMAVGYRLKRTRSQAFYNEDSLCSTLTTTDSCESELENVPKRPKMGKHKACALATQRAIYINRFEDEEELRYHPLSLMTLALNVINAKNCPDFEPDDFYTKIVHPKCGYCAFEANNTKLLALHEAEHMKIEMGDKVDVEGEWQGSRDDFEVRAKWWEGRETDDCDDLMDTSGSNLLIPIGSEVAGAEEGSVDMELEGDTPQIRLMEGGHAYVNGIPLVNYPKEQRKSFFKCIKLGTRTYKYCENCRYVFKDFYAIESHYLSLACAYNCRYCGKRYNRQRNHFEGHVRAHKAMGHQISGSTFTSARNALLRPHQVEYISPVPDLDDPATPTPPLLTPPAPPRARPGPKPSKPPEIRVKNDKDLLANDLDKTPGRIVQAYINNAPNQAYFCRKCYKVFFKLDEFNIHSRNCENSPGGGSRAPIPLNNVVDEEKVDLSPAGRPIRQAVRDSASYKDRSESPSIEARERDPNTVCPICNHAFGSIFGRNSHMRIHKPDYTPKNEPKKPNSNAKLPGGRLTTEIKREPHEPEVEIYEQESKYKMSSSIGAVSITPISKNPNQKPTINANIMKLVQSNPHLTIKANKEPERNVGGESSSNHSSESDGKNYKCSGCETNFNNKSHLYFHKKSECGGSRFPCPFCKKRFGTEAAYSSHIYYSHPE